MAHDILIVDDESDIRMLTAGVLEDEGHETREAPDSTAALAAIEARRPNLVLLDILFDAKLVRNIRQQEAKKARRKSWGGW